MTIDLHADIPWDVCTRREHGETQVLVRHHLPKLRKGCIDAAVFAICVENDFKPDRALKRGLQFIEGVYQELSETEDFSLATSASDVLKAKEDNKIAVILGIEGGEVIEQDIRLLRIFHKLGIRIFGLTWNQRNLIADGIGEERTHGGISNFGVNVIEECNSLGIIVDIAHISKSGFYDALEISEKPVIVSHSSIETIRNRGINDDQIKKLADNGGLLGICAVTSTKDDPPGSIDLIVKEMDYIKYLVGVEHLAFGPDYYDFLFPILKRDIPDIEYVLMPGLEDASKTPNLIKKLSEKSFSKDEIRMIMGENFLRLFKVGIK